MTNEIQKNSDYIKNSLLILHGYLAVLLIFISSFLVFKFYDYEQKGTREVRPTFIELVNHDFDVYDRNPSPEKLDGTPLAISRDGKERMAFMVSTVLASALVFLSLFFFKKNPDFCARKTGNISTNISSH